MFGCLLGLAVFFAFCIIIEFDKIEPENFFFFIHKFKYIIIPILLILFAISVTLGYTQHNKYEYEYRQVLEEYCKFGEKPSFGKSTAYHSGIIFILIGGYLGILFLIYKINQKYKNEKEIFYNWNNGSILSIIKIIIFAFILPAIPVLAIFVLPYEYFTLKFILEVVIYFLYGFFGLGLCFYYACAKFNDKNLDHNNNNNNNNNTDNNNINNNIINNNNNNYYGSNRDIVVNTG
jgi:hypothetical protein